MLFLRQVGGGDADVNEDDDWREVDEDYTLRLSGFFQILSVYLFLVLFEIHYIRLKNQI